MRAYGTGKCHRFSKFANPEITLNKLIMTDVYTKGHWTQEEDQVIIKAVAQVLNDK
jgi:hypothetical protein